MSDDGQRRRGKDRRYYFDVRQEPLSACRGCGGNAFAPHCNSRTCQWIACVACDSRHHVSLYRRHQQGE